MTITTFKLTECKYQLYLVIALSLQLFVKCIEQQREELLTVVLLSPPKLRMSVCKRVLEPDRLQLTILARPDVLKEGPEVIRQTGNDIFRFRRSVAQLAALRPVAFGEVFDDGRSREQTLKPRVHVASVGKVGKAADAGHGVVRLDVLLELWIVAASLRGGRFDQVKESAEVGIVVSSLKSKTVDVFSLKRFEFVSTTHLQGFHNCVLALVQK